jgi:hypothetical protein
LPFTSQESVFYFGGTNVLTGVVPTFPGMSDMFSKPPKILIDSPQYKFMPTFTSLTFDPKNLRFLQLFSFLSNRYESPMSFGQKHVTSTT